MSERAVDRVLGALRRSDLDYRPSAHEHERWMAQCPAHDDRSPSLSIAAGEVGPDREPGALIHCFAGCNWRDVVSALELDAADLYDGERRTNGNGKASSRSKRAKQQAEAVRPKTDLGNAERLVTAHGPDMRSVHGLGWHVFDGRVWRRDTDGAVMRFAKQVPRRMLDEAARLEDADARKELATWAVKSESEPRLRAMVALAETEETVVAAPEALDAQLFIFNAENGTVDLTSGELREHRRDDLITKLAPVVYEPNARDPAWDAFLESTTGGDGELAAFLRRAAGYTLTGETGEEALFFAHGREATGKSTFLEALKATLGDYAKTADFETFVAHRGESGPRADVARLMGARMVASLEVDEGKRLAEGLVKQLTGGDTVAARFLYRESFEFRPAFKLWLAANARPRVSADDGAIWRRIIQVPFVEQVPEHERDPELKRHLTTDPHARSAILAWAVRGCLEWRRDGLAVPERVRDYTAEYRAENDPVAEWLKACCEFNAEAVTAAGELRSSYEAWAERNGEKAISAKALGAALRARGCTSKPTKRQRTWQGIALLEGDG